MSSSKNHVSNTQADASAARQLLHETVSDVTTDEDLRFFEDYVLPSFQDATSDAENALQNARTIYSNDFDQEIEPLIDVQVHHRKL